MATIKTIYGEIVAPGAVDEDLIAKCLSIYGEWAYAEALIASTLAKSGDRLWDIGAYAGTFALGVAGNKKIASVLAVDANPDVATALKVNLATNLSIPFDQVTAGVARRAGVGTILPGNAGNRGASVFHMDSGEQNFNEVCVRAQTLKELRAVCGNYDFLKLDIEGMEVDALLGDDEYIQKHKPVIWTECNENLQSLVLLDVILSLGYAPVYIAFPAIRSDNFLGSTNQLFPMAYEAALVGAPLDRLESLSASAVSDPCVLRSISCRNDLLQALWDTPRWSLAEWTKLSRPELIARIGRMERSEKLATFLNYRSTNPSTQNDLYSKVGFSPGVDCSDSISSYSSHSVFETKLFWRKEWLQQHAGYSENRAISLSTPVDGREHVLRLCFPEGIGRVERLRLDLLDAPGVVDIHSLRLLDSAETIIWSWTGEVAVFQKLSQLNFIFSKLPTTFVTAISFGNDPSFELELSPDVYNRITSGCCLEIKITPYQLLDRLPLILNFHTQEEQLAVSHISKDFCQFKSKLNLASNLAATKVMLESSIEIRDQLITQQQNQLNGMRAELLRAEAQLSLITDLMRGSTDHL